MDQFGPPTPTGAPFGEPDPFASDDERGPMSDENVVVGDQFAQARGTAPPGGLTGPAAARALEDPGGLWAGSVPAPQGSMLGLQGQISPGRGGAAPTSGPAPDDTPMTGLTPELAASLATPPDTPAAAPAPAAPDTSAPAPGYTAADAAASQPSTERFSPAPNIGTAIMQAIFGLGGAAIGGPISGFLNQNLASTLGGVGAVPGVSEIASVLGSAQTVGGMTGAIASRAGSPSERAQPNIASMLWDMINGRASTSRGLSPIGYGLRTTVPGYVFGRDDRTEPGAPPPATDPRTYDQNTLRGVTTTAPGLPPNPTLQQLREALMVPQDFDRTGGNQAGDNRVMDSLLAALGLDPTGDQPTTGPTDDQLPSTFPGYFAGGDSNLNPEIIGQRTAFDPRRFVA
jgi:hypothetical protein